MASDFSDANVGRRRTLAISLFVITVAALAAAAGAYSYAKWKGNLPKDHVLEAYGLNRPVKNQLAPQYKDANGDLLADTPTNAADQLEPETLKLNYLATEQEHYAELLAPFIAYLSEKIGQPVVYQAYESPDDQLRAIKDGEAHIVGVNTGLVPTAVNGGGFIPLCSFGSEAGLATYTMQFIVPKGSSIADPKQINGHMLTLTEPTSNSGWKVPMIVLLRDFQLQPVRDFDVVYSGSHGDSIRGIAGGQYEVAAVASDEVALAVARDEVKEGDIQVIYSSEPFCNNAFGVPHNLKPELVDAIRTAFVTYPWEGTDIQKEFATIGADRFKPIDYKADFKLLREIDDAMGRRHEISEPSKKPERPNA